VLNRIRSIQAAYPRPFWFIFWGMLINASGGSMVWPFLTIYLRTRLDVPLTQVALLLTINAVSGLCATFLAGPAVDRIGRKSAMLSSLVVSGGMLLTMSAAGTYIQWVGIMIVYGAFSPLLRVGGNAMVADLVETERRGEAYALLRTISNLGVAIGPSIGGFVASASYRYAFFMAATAHVIYALLLMGFVRETLPRGARAKQAHGSRGYTPIFRDGAFLGFSGIYTLSGLGYSLMMVLLPVYAYENFGILEKQYGFIMATNAAMVVLLQYFVTRVTARYPALPVLATGSLFYALGVGSVALGRSFFAFWSSMVVLTIGEMIMIPTSTALTANLAPADMRGRYMGIYSLAWGIGVGVSPVFGGFLNDAIAPVAIWYFGLTTGLLGAFGFVLLNRTIPPSRLEAEPSSPYAANSKRQPRPLA
jgi:MFS family permease